MSEERKAQILAVLEAGLPETIRIMNPSAITVEIEAGPDCSVAEEEALPDETFEQDDEVLAEMIEEGTLKVGEALGHAIVGLSLEYQDKLKAEGRLGA